MFHNFCLQDGVIDQLYELLVEHFSVDAHTIGFPELALPSILQVGVPLVYLSVVVVPILLTTFPRTSAERIHSRDTGRSPSNLPVCFYVCPY